MSKQAWSDTDTATLKEMAGGMGVRDIARKLKRSIASVRSKADKMGWSLAVGTASVPPQEPEERAKQAALETLARELKRHRAREGDLSVLSEKLGNLAAE